MRVDATCPKVFFPVEFLHCSQCVSQYLNVCHHTSQRTLPRCEVTSLHYFGRKHLNMHPADLDFSVDTSSAKRKLEPAVYRSNNNGELRHSTTGIVVQRNKVPSTTLNQRGLERLSKVYHNISVDQLQHLLMNIWTKYHQIRDLLSDHTMMSLRLQMREVHWPSALLLADLFNQTLFSDHPTLSWTFGPVGMIDGVMTARK